MHPLVLPERDGLDQDARFRHHVEDNIGQMQRNIDPASVLACQQHLDIGVAVGPLLAADAAAEQHCAYHDAR